MKRRPKVTFRFDTIQFDLIAFCVALRCFQSDETRVNDEEFRRHVCKLKVTGRRPGLKPMDRVSCHSDKNWWMRAGGCVRPHLSY